MTHPLDRLAAVDAARLGTGLPVEHARAAWATAIAGARTVDTTRPLAGTAPSRVVIIASANVFTAPIEWAWALSARGVSVVLKSARGLRAVGEAIATALPEVEAHDWVGGDLAGEAAAMTAAAAVLCFGSAETIAAVRSRAGVPVFGFGPRFGVALVDRLDAQTATGSAMDHALYDGRGCMSPAGVFVKEAADLGPLRRALEEADTSWPPGERAATDAVDRRTLTMLATAVGRVHHVGGWLVVELPAAHFRPRGLPRVVTIHPAAGIDTAIAPWRDELGTIALNHAAEGDVGGHPALADGLGLAGLPPARVCAIGEMQRPPGSRRLHDGVDVLARLWERPLPTPGL
ncbi:MAG: hypothetical protein EXR71_00375 [Myxococcales bacterium]|nr:hypothetical protein [Myxococcales bacterium]